jgi:integrase
MPRRRRDRDRVYYRDDRGYYADFRDYADVGGKREAMIDPRTGRTTHDPDVADSVFNTRFELLKALRENGNQEVVEDPGLVDYIRRHLELKAGYRAARTVERDAQALNRVVAWFGETARLSDVTVKALSEYVQQRRREPGAKKGSTVAPQTILHELHALSSVMKRAVAEEYVPANPVGKLADKPQLNRAEAEWLEIGEAARVITSAFAVAQRSKRAAPALGELVATCLLTGGRRNEVFGLEVRDIDLERGIVHIRPNAWRGIKSRRARWVPLWPQLRAILTDYLDRTGRTDGLLFPTPSGRMYGDLRASLSNVLDDAQVEKHVTWHTLRHSYVAARLQTLDQGSSVSPFTVAREVGHRSLKLIEDTYGHLLHTRHRMPVLEYKEAKVLDIGARTA